MNYCPLDSHKEPQNESRNESQNEPRFHPCVSQGSSNNADNDSSVAGISNPVLHNALSICKDSNENAINNQSLMSVCPESIPGLSCIAWNVNGLGDKLGYQHILKCLLQFDIIFLTETWLDADSKSDPDLDISGYETNNYPRSSIHKKAYRASGGLMLYVKKSISKYVTVVKNVCDHFIVISINESHVKTFVIFCYILPSDTPYLCKSCDGNYIETLVDLYINYSAEGHVYICGDMNGRTGHAPDMPRNYFVNDLFCDLDEPSLRNVQMYDSTLPKRYSEDTTVNTQGRALLDLCKESDLRIVNGRHSRDKGIGQYTFIRGNSKSVIDYLISQANNFDNILYFSVGVKPLESDHCPIVFKLKCAFPKEPPPSKDIPSEPYRKFIWSPELIGVFHDRLSDDVGLEYTAQYFDSIESLQPPHIVAQTFSQLIENTAERSLRKTKPPKTNGRSKSSFPCNNWFDSECKKAKRKLSHAKNSGLHTNSEINVLEKNLKALVQKKKRRYKLNNTANILEAKNSTELWKKLESLAPKKNSPTCLSLKDFQEFYSKPAVNNADNNHNFDLDHQKEIYNFIKTYMASPSSPESITCQENPMGENAALIHDFLNSIIAPAEITCALKKLKKGKSPGTDGIPIDLFIDCEKTLNPLLLELFNYLLLNEEYPSDWALGLVNPVHKGGPDLVENFRKISILPAISKILETIMNTRLEFVDKAFNLEDPYNGGFKKNSRTADNIFILNGLIDQAKNTNTELFVCFVDFRRAFDCINRKFMFYKLLKQGYSSKTLRLIMNMYGKTKSSVKLNGFLAKETFDEVLGVAQGGILSPYLFKSFLSDMSSLFSSMYGVSIDEETILCYLLWADDLVLFSNSPQGLQDHLNKLHTYCSKWQLIVNNLKTKVLIFNQKKRNVIPKFSIGGTPIEVSKKYKYLGTLFSTVRQTEETKAYVQNSCSRALYKIKRYCRNLGQLPPSTAMNLFDSLVAPLLDYSSEIWYRESIVKKLETFHLKYLKRVLKVRIQTPTLAVYGELGQFPIRLRLQGNILKYLHRVSNMPTTSLVYKTLCMLKRYNTMGKNNWLSRAIKVFNSFNAITDMSLDAFLSKPESYIKSFIKSKLQKSYELDWKSNISDLDAQPKLRTYCTVKCNIKPEPYLALIIPKHRQALAKFRCSSHHLAVETGRHRKPKLPVEERLCSDCNVLEDEIHHLINCSKNETHRKTLFNIACSKIDNFNSLDSTSKFQELLMCKDLKVQKEIAVFLLNSSQ